MSQIIPIYIPTYIGDQNYNPNRVLPRLFFYNGLIDCEDYYIESGSLTNSGIPRLQNQFPYFDNYNVVSGSFPTINSDSLLFNNENASYGQLPTGSLYTTYWETYVNLLYNPRTRLFNCEAIIPLADYYKMELNDICEWRGNYYHLRAINDYNLKNGECKIQLLGPLQPPVISNLLPELECNFAFTSSVVTTTTTTTIAPTTTTTLAPTTTTTSTTTTSTTTTSTTTTSTTTTLAPTTTTTFAPSTVFRAVGCCDSTSYYVNWTATFETASGATFYNPVENTCMTVVENVPSQSVSFTINNANESTYNYGYGAEQCNRCKILGAHICPGETCYSYRFENISSFNDEFRILNCAGTASSFIIDSGQTIITCSYATPIPYGHTPPRTIVTNLGVCI